MTNGYPMRCRFDRDGHGTFANAVALRKHYDEAHPEYAAAAALRAVKPAVVAQAERVRCNLCGSELLYGSWRKHRVNRHGGVATYTAVGGRVVAVVVPPAPSRPAERQPEADPVPLTVDDIVLPAIEVMSLPGKVVPVAHLAALFAWRDATAVMLAAVGARG